MQIFIHSFKVLLLILVVGELRAEISHFVDVTRETNINVVITSGTKEKTQIVESTTGGIVVFDYDDDGAPDLFFTNGWSLSGFDKGRGPRDALYRNDLQWNFVDVANDLGINQVDWGMGATAVDYDADGRIDLYLCNYGPNTLYDNGLDGFVDVSEKVGVAHPGWGSSAAFGDYDNDGDLDFYLTNYVEFDAEFFVEDREKYCSWRGLTDVFCGPHGLPGANDVLFRNEGQDNGWSFVDASSAFGLNRYAYYSLGAVSGDYDDDGDLDIYIANDSTPNVLYRNDGGYFVDIALAAGVAFEKDGRAQSGMGIAVGDPDKDGDFDLFVTNFSHDHNTHYENDGLGNFRDVSWPMGFGLSSLSYLGWGAGFFDYDHDGDEDLFVSNGHVFPSVDSRDMGTRYHQTNQLYENLDGSRFVDVSEVAGLGFQIEESSRGSGFGDFDGDGDLDIAIINLDATPTLLRNDVGNRRNWLQVKLRSYGSNTRAIGARLTAWIGEEQMMREARAGVGYLSQDQGNIHFGLGAAIQVDSLVVRWPDGVVERHLGLTANQLVTLRHDLP